MSDELAHLPDSQVARLVARLLVGLADDLEHDGYYRHASAMRDAGQVVTDRFAPDTPAGGCRRCHAPLTRRPLGRPPIYCSARCRRAAHRERKRDEMV